MLVYSTVKPVVNQRLAKAWSFPDLVYTEIRTFSRRYSLFFSAGSKQERSLNCSIGKPLSLSLANLGASWDCSAYTVILDTVVTWPRISVVLQHPSFQTVVKVVSEHGMDFGSW